MTYEPRAFWEQRLREQFDLRGTGETGLSLAYNQACYSLRRWVLDRALADAHVDPAGAAVLDIGSGTGFFVAYYLARGARVTGVDITTASVERLSQRHPEARFVLADVSDEVPTGPFEIVNAFDVLYHITDDARWERALQNLAREVAPGGLLLVSDVFDARGALAEHNVVRPLERYRGVLERAGLRIERCHPTHVLLNRELGRMRPLNRLPWLLHAIDRAMLGFGWAPRRGTNQLLVARCPA